MGDQGAFVWHCAPKSQPTSSFMNSPRSSSIGVKIARFPLYRLTGSNRDCRAPGSQQGACPRQVALQSRASGKGSKPLPASGLTPERDCFQQVAHAIVEDKDGKPAKILAVSYEAAIDQLFKRMRSSSSPQRSLRRTRECSKITDPASARGLVRRAVLQISDRGLCRRSMMRRVAHRG